MKKTLMSILISLALVLSFAVTGCKKNDVVDTYTGAVSEATYESTDEAVKGFLETELSGETLKAVFVAYEKESELSDKEIKALELGADHTEGLQSVEKGTVEYKEEETDSIVASLAEESAPQTFKRIVYVLKYTENGYKYYTPAVQVGETITKSYYESIFNPEHYLNCTLKGETITADGKDIFKFSAEYKFTETAAFGAAQIFYGDEDYSDVSYLIDSDYGLYSVDYRDEWIAYLADDLYPPVNSVSEFTLTAFNELLNVVDYNWLVKTETGYALREGKERAFIERVFGRSGGSDIVVKAEYNMIVKDGRVDGAHWIVTAEYNGRIEESYEGTYTITDVGTTKLDVPAEVMEAIKAAAAE